jgi:DNA-binding LacI/PurR family transcriptional regulator
MASEYDSDIDIPRVTVDDYTATEQAISYLISTGRKKIALLNFTTETLQAQLREKAYRDTLEKSGCEVSEHRIYHMRQIFSDPAYSAAINMLSEDDRPDAIFCTADVYACAAIRAAHFLNLRIPEDVAIMGFDNTNLAILCSPQLTTVSMPMYQIGYQSVNLLCDQLENLSISNAGRNIVLPTEVVVRSST